MRREKDRDLGHENGCAGAGSAPLMSQRFPCGRMRRRGADGDQKGLEARTLNRDRMSSCVRWHCGRVGGRGVKYVAAAAIAPFPELHCTWYSMWRKLTHSGSRSLAETHVLSELPDWAHCEMHEMK